jgi:hypothetical protein
MGMICRYRMRRKRLLSTGRKIGIIWDCHGARSVAGDVSATAPLFCGQNFFEARAWPSIISVRQPSTNAAEGSCSGSAATACNAANAVAQTTDARFLSSMRAVKLAAKYADARAEGRARNRHGCYLDEILDRKIAARLPRHRPRQIERRDNPK